MEVVTHRNGAYILGRKKLKRQNERETDRKLLLFKMRKKYFI